MDVENNTAFWITGYQEARLGPVPEPTFPASETPYVIVRSRYSGISRGTESLVYNNQVPENEYQRMRAPFQEGDFPFPVKYGYASVGEVVDGPEALLGQNVFCLHPHQQRYAVPASAVLPLPAQVPAERAVLAANMELGSIKGVLAVATLICSLMHALLAC